MMMFSVRLSRICRPTAISKTIAISTVAITGSFRATMKPPIAFDPFIKAEDAAKLGVKLVTLDELMRTADFVSIHCPLTDQTRGIIGKREIVKEPFAA